MSTWTDRERLGPGSWRMPCVVRDTLRSWNPSGATEGIEETKQAGRLPGAPRNVHFRPWHVSSPINASESVTCSETSDSLRPYGLKPTRLLCPWDSPGQNTGGVAISFSRGSSWPRGRIWVSCTAGRFFTVWAIKEAPNKCNVSFNQWKMCAYVFWCELYVKYILTVKSQ